VNPNNRYWWFVIVSFTIALALVVSLGFFLWQQLSSSETQLILQILRDRFIYIFGLIFVLLAGLGFILDAIFNNYIIPINKLTEEITLINSVNPSHRIKVEGSKEIMRLVNAINEGANRLEELRANVEQKIQMAKADLEEEKNLLAAFMAELPEGVLICNAEGRILFYNKRAKEFLEGHNNNDSPLNKSGRFIGLGRSVFGVIDKSVIVHALDEIAEKLKRKEMNIAVYFVIVGKESNLLRVEAVPILNQQRQFTGFIMIFYDITQQLQVDSRVDFLLKNLSRGIRASVASIRAAIEAILEYPHMGQEQLTKFNKIIHKESLALGVILDNAAIDYSSHVKTEWPLVKMPVQDLVETIAKRADNVLDIQLSLETNNLEEWVRVDSYSIIMAIIFVLNQLKNEMGGRNFSCTLGKKGRFVNIDLLWEGSSIKMETLKKWDEQPLMIEDEGIPLTLKEVVGHHEAEIWSYSCRDAENQSYLRICLPAVEAVESDNIRTMTIVPESRPEFYDFDLFNQPGQTPELDNQPLSSLTYTVFDTETTGLDTRGGDEIIAIGAVRVVNGRILHEEIYDQLIDPKRHVPIESIKIHGIQPEMLQGQPVIDQVLPLFYQFSEETILVAHNAAFDMRMLELKENQTGITFTNPVLDTLLLAAVVHPAQENQNLEAIAKRLGISIVGRHTALGDALATAEVFLKFLPLLAQQGIHTLKEARLASKKTMYARLKY
jgi:DNA polymerase III subunit epsilon